MNVVYSCYYRIASGHVESEEILFYLVAKTKLFLLFFVEHPTLYVSICFFSTRT
jgi:hypothetical protein